MSLIAAGDNSYSQTGLNSTGNVMGLVQFDAKSVSNISAGWNHTIIIDKSGQAYGLGNDLTYQIGSAKRQILKTPTRIIIDEEIFQMAACTQFDTMYLTINGKIIICSEKSQSSPIRVQISKPIVYISGSYSELCAIDNVGGLYLFFYDPHEPPVRYQLPKPVFDVARGDGFVIAVTTDGVAYGNGLLNNGSNEFVPIPSLRDEKIQRVFAYFNHAAVITNTYEPMTWGSNSKGQLGRGKTSNWSNEFGQIQALEGQKIVDIALGYESSMFVTSTGLLYSCGWNKYGQLMQGHTKRINIPTKIENLKGKAVHVQCGDKHSFALFDVQPLPHFGMKAFNIEFRRIAENKSSLGLREGLSFRKQSLTHSKREVSSRSSRTKSQRE